jgi:hypothetical protein
VQTPKARPFARLAGTLLVSSAVVCAAGTAHADVSSWFFAGGGAAVVDQPTFGKSPIGLMQLETGMGTPPTNALVVGGLLKTMTFFGHGTDLALVARVATVGFVRGSWGVAVDAGGFERWWGPVGSGGGIGALVLGAPVGIQASAFAETGTSDMRTFGFTIGVDLMRLTVHRTTALSYWTNPYRLDPR